MMHRAAMNWLAVAATAALAACGGGGGGTPIDAAPTDAATDAPTDAPIDAAVVLPVFRNPVAMPDLELARAASAQLGVGSTLVCDQCHALTRETFDRWQTETHVADTCLGNLHPTSSAQAKAIMDCFRALAGNAFDPRKVGIYSTGGSLAWFQAVMELAYGETWQTEWASWGSRVLMPRGTQAPFTQPQFDLVAEWFARGLPRLTDVIDSTPPPDGCVEGIAADVATHVSAMQTAGWGALNHDDGINMLGCAGAATPRDCLATFPLSTASAFSMRWAEALPASKIRILDGYDHRSSFWTRSSADGRFVAHGGGPGGATIIDLQTGREIPADAAYDPGFFPDNSGFVIQGGARAWCRQSLLTSNPAMVSFTEPECSAVGVVGLYQHLGAVRNGDYWAVAGQFVSDNGGGEPSANFGAGGQGELTPMIWNGTAYTARPEVSFASPFEGDTIIAPSAKLLLSRASYQGAQSGFTLRRLDATPSGNSYTVSTPVIGRYCVSGGKPAFSYDERWITYHHWVQAGDWQSLGFASATDPEFVAMRQAGTANIFLLDITTGVSVRVTRMNAGQSALFPHFRSDGWLYFIVKDDATPNHETVAASDAALLLAP